MAGFLADLGSHTCPEIIRLGENIDLTFEQCIFSLKARGSQTKSEKEQCYAYSLQCLLQELEKHKCMPLELCYDEFNGMIPENFHSTSTVHADKVRKFTNKLLSRKGLPVLRVKSNTRFYIVYWPKCEGLEYSQQLGILNWVLTLQSGVDISQEIGNSIDALMPLFTTGKDKALVICLLTSIFSGSQMRFLFGFEETRVNSVKEVVQGYAEQFAKEESKLLILAKEKLDASIGNLETKLQDKKEWFKRSPGDQSWKEINEMNLEMMEDKISYMKSSKPSLVKKLAARELKKWKNSLHKQYGKGKGTHRIDRGAELEVYHHLQERLVAHKSRTGPALLEKRAGQRELQLIANKWLKQHGKKMIKSCETIRSWSKPKRKGSIQSKQHRGKSLWAYSRLQRKHVTRHINMHYNRAHIKMLTRKFFSKDESLSSLTIRRCIDDKAYLRCGTSEGFCRPFHTPLTLVNEKATVPAYDFPDQVGYVAPGVNLIIKEMEEKKPDTFAMSDVTISVTVKPKLYYSSSATNWCNDMYKDRLNFPAEHEVAKSGLQMNEEGRRNIVFLFDSLQQYVIMSKGMDYESIIDNSAAFLWELKRLETLQSRLVSSKGYLEEYVCFTAINACAKAVTEARDIFQQMSVGSRDGIQLIEQVLTSIKDTISDIKEYVPVHRPIDIQTSDAGPGVGTKENIVRLRLVEQFLINDLDYQARFHFAPQDSKSHPVERVMSALNDAVGDGRFISIPDFTVPAEDIHKLSSDEIAAESEKRKKDASYACANTVASRFAGCRSLGTSINAHVPDKEDLEQLFFFDESDMKKWNDAKSISKRALCPGNGYYSFLQSEFEQKYIHYDNGVEGIRQEGPFRCGVELQRVPPPVPNYELSSHKEFHYHDLKTLPVALSKVTNRTKDDFCPRVQLQNFVAQCGTPDISFEKGKDGKMELVDKNDTYGKIHQGIPDFLKTMVGLDFELAARKEADKIYIRTMKALKKSSQLVDPFLAHYHTVFESDMKIKIVKSSPGTLGVLPWGGWFNDIEMINTCTVDNLLYCCHVLQEERLDLSESFRNSQGPLKLLNEVHILFKEKKFHQGKHLWLKQFKQDQQSPWDCYGSEYDYSFEKLGLLMKNSYTSVCSNPDCSKPSRLMVTNIINSECPGIRTTSPRVFVNGPPALFCIEVPRDKRKHPLTMNLWNTEYKLHMVTYGNGGHFCAAMFFQKRWWLYDGLKEYHVAKTGLKAIKKPFAPNGYTANYLLYVSSIWGKV